MNLSSMTRRLGIAIPACLAVAVAAAAQRRPADLIVTNARAVSMNRQHPRATAFAVRDGNFVAVGDAADVVPYRGAKTRVIDARGHAVYPASSIRTRTPFARGGSTTRNCGGTARTRSGAGWR